MILLLIAAASLAVFAVAPPSANVKRLPWRRRCLLVGAAPGQLNGFFSEFSVGPINFFAPKTTWATPWHSNQLVWYNMGNPRHNNQLVLWQGTLKHVHIHPCYSSSELLYSLPLLSVSSSSSMYSPSSLVSKKLSGISST